MKWFTGKIETVDDLKAQFKVLCMKHHPDKGGSTADMQEINAEYDVLFAKLKNVHRAASGETYEQESNEAPEEFKDILNAIIGCEGIEIEVCGCWLWITGETRKNKEILKAAGCRWSKKKEAWYWHSAGFVKKSKRTLSMDEIRIFYGSESINNKRRETPFALGKGTAH